MIQRKKDQFEKNPKNPPLKKWRKVSSRLSGRSWTSKSQKIWWRIKISFEINDTLQNNLFITQEHKKKGTQGTNSARGHWQTEKLKWEKLQKLTNKIRMKIPTSWFFQGLSPKKEKVLARWLAESWLLWLPEPEMPTQHINCLAGFWHCQLPEPEICGQHKLLSWVLTP
jgi:hypothetical protein